MTVIAARNRELKQMLTARRREIQLHVEDRLREGRSPIDNHGRDAMEQTDDDSQGEIELALLQMRAETLARIDQALERLEAGQYGTCIECETEIAERRLRALPFAVRCQLCEEAREQAQTLTRRRDGPVLVLSPG